MLSRREFLRTSMQSMAVVSLGLGVPSVFAKAAVAAKNEASAGAGRTLVVVQLQGGMDGLNIVIPQADPAYRSARPSLGIAEDKLINVDASHAFHPSMTAMKQLLDDGHLAVVEGAGYPDPTYSHFKAMDIWQSADPAARTRDGWLGRYFDSLTDIEGHPLAGLSVGRALPAAFQAQKATVPSVESLDTFALQGPDDRDKSLIQLYDEYRPAGTPFAALLDSTIETAMSSSAQLNAAHASYKPSVTYPQSSLASGLQMIAELIDSGSDGQSPLRVGHVMLSGFDTHTQEAQRLAPLLQDTGEALSAFWQDVVAHGHGDDVLVMTWSEFGRRVAENAQDGTDHGSAGPMFLVGNKIKPGFHGQPPALTNLDNGNLRFTTDFRSVYATLLEDWLEADSKAILGDSFEKVGILDL
ncbi:MAG TPA: DUF1501 domain-containing protein [Dehalococcoidia bacterium]|nr:DUF1501 domain-containing protein [Dehalococcoidia bacterium]